MTLSPPPSRYIALGASLLVYVACSDNTPQQPNLVPVSVDPANVQKTTTHIAGRVLDAQTRTPIQAVLIDSFAPTQTVQTREDGTFALINNVADNEVYRVFASHPDYGDQTTTVFTTPNQANTADLLLVPKANVSPLTISPPSLLLSHTQHSTLAKLSNPTNTPLQWCIPHTDETNQPSPLRFEPSFGTIPPLSEQHIRTSLNSNIYPNRFSSPTNSTLYTSRHPISIHEIPPNLPPNSCQTTPNTPPQRLRLADSLTILDSALDYTFQTQLREPNTTSICYPTPTDSLDPNCTFGQRDPSQPLTFDIALRDSSPQPRPVAFARVNITLQHEGTTLLNTTTTTDLSGTASTTFSSALPTGSYTISTTLDILDDSADNEPQRIALPTTTHFFVGDPSPPQIAELRLHITDDTGQELQGNPTTITQRPFNIHIQALLEDGSPFTPNEPTPVSLTIPPLSEELFEAFNSPTTLQADGTAVLSVAYVGPTVGTTPLELRVAALPTSLNIERSVFIQPNIPEEFDSILLSVPDSPTPGTLEEPVVITDRSFTLRIETRGSDGTQPLPLEEERAFILNQEDTIAQTNPDTPIQLRQGTIDVPMTYTGPNTLDAFGVPLSDEIITLQVGTNPNPENGFTSTISIQPHVLPTETFQTYTTTLLDPDTRNPLQDPLNLTTRNAIVRIQTRGSEGTSPLPNRTPHSVSITVLSPGLVHIDDTPVTDTQPYTAQLNDGTIDLPLAYLGLPTLDLNGTPLFSEQTITFQITENTPEEPKTLEHTFGLHIQHQGYSLQTRLRDTLSNAILGDDIDASLCAPTTVQTRLIRNNLYDTQPAQFGIQGTYTHSTGFSRNFGPATNVPTLPPNPDPEEGWTPLHTILTKNLLDNRGANARTLDGDWTIDLSPTEPGLVNPTEHTFTLNNASAFPRSQRLLIEAFTQISDNPTPSPETLDVGTPTFIRIQSRNDAGCNEPRNITLTTTFADSENALPFVCPPHLTPEQCLPQLFEYTQGPDSSSWENPTLRITSRGPQQDHWVTLTGQRTGLHTLTAETRIAGNDQTATVDTTYTLNDPANSATGISVHILEHGAAHARPDNLRGQPITAEIYVHDTYGNPLPDWEIFALGGPCPRGANHDVCVSLTPQPIPLNEGENTPTTTIEIGSIRHHAYNTELSGRYAHNTDIPEIVLAPEHNPPNLRNDRFLHLPIYATHPDRFSAEPISNLAQLFFYPSFLDSENDVLSIQLLDALGAIVGGLLGGIFGNDASLNAGEDVSFNVCLRDPSFPTDTTRTLDNADLPTQGTEDRNLILSLDQITTPNGPLFTEPAMCSLFTPGHGTQIEPPETSGVICTIQTADNNPELNPGEVCARLTLELPDESGTYELQFSIHHPQVSTNPEYGYHAIDRTPFVETLDPIQFEVD